MGFHDTCVSAQTIKNNFEVFMREKPVVSNEIIIKANRVDDYLKGTQTGLFQLKPDSLRVCQTLSGKQIPFVCCNFHPEWQKVK